MHPRMEQWVQRWRDLHPTWTHKLWRDADPATIVCGSERVESRWPDLLRRACHQAQRSNIWRFELVFQQGGAYLDTDMEPLANIESAIGDHDSFVTSLWDNRGCSACFGARPGHAFVEDAVQSLGGCDPTVSLSMGAQYSHEVYLRHQAEVHRIPREVIIFYPNSNPKITDAQVAPETLAVHRWSCWWYPTGYAPIG